jgi:predicted MFS family arabinose efflux permease
MVQGIAVVAAAFGLGRLLNRWSPAVIQTGSLLLLAVSLLLIGTVLDWYRLALGAALLGVGSALVGMARTLQLSRMKTSMSKLSGLYNLGNMSGALAGSLLGGLLAELVGLQNLFLLWIPPLLVVALFCRIRSART